ncbi:protein of unknown function [Clostridium beijerinckii]|nr:protein of unknown function [Clostridium beijerinckii]
MIESLKNTKPLKGILLINSIIPNNNYIEKSNISQFTYIC